MRVKNNKKKTEEGSRGQEGVSSDKKIDFLAFFSSANHFFNLFFRGCVVASDFLFCFRFCVLLLLLLYCGRQNQCEWTAGKKGKSPKVVETAYRENGIGPTRIRTGVVRIRTESDDHYTMEPDRARL